MNWSDGANLYLLKSVNQYGKNWSLVSSALSVIADTFLKHDKLKDFSDKSCSLQYKYLIASTRQLEARFSYLTEEILLTTAIARYSELRTDQIKHRRVELIHRMGIETEDNRKLLSGRFNEISPENLLVYRKRCRAFGLSDVIAETLELGDLSPNPEEDKAIRRAVRYADNADNGLCHATIDRNNGLWIPVLPENFKNFFSPRTPSSPNTLWNNGFVEIDETNRQPMEDTSPLWSPAKPTKVEPKTPSRLDENLTGSSSSNATTPTLKQRSISMTGTSKRTILVSGEAVKRPAPEDYHRSPITDEVLSPSQSLPMNEEEEEANRIVKVTASRIINKLEYAASVGTPNRLSSKSRNRSQQQQHTLDSGDRSLTGSPVPPSVASMGRRWRRGLLSALATVCSHRHAHVFLHAVTDDIAPGYSNMIRYPVDLTSLRRRVETSLTCLAGGGMANSAATSPSTTPTITVATAETVIVHAAGQLLRDLLLMFGNARMYNNREHTVHRMAGEMCADVFAELRPLWAVLAEDISGFPPLPGGASVQPISMLRRRNMATMTAGGTPSGPHSPTCPPPQFTSGQSTSSIPQPYSSDIASETDA